MSDITLAFLLCFVSTAVLHCLLFSVWKTKGERFWKASDYCWLGVAVIGLWGVAERYKAQDIARRIHAQEVFLEREYSGQQAWITTLMNFELQNALLKIEGDPNKEGFLRPKVMQHLMAHHFYTNLQLRLSSKRPYRQHRSELEAAIREIESSSDGGKSVASETFRLLERAIPEEEMLDSLRLTANGSYVRRKLARLSPFVLAIALALRLTRVTAEVFMLRRPVGSATGSNRTG